jgi:membrane fusion protein, copper/silver efflux system
MRDSRGLSIKMVLLLVAPIVVLAFLGGSVLRGKPEKTEQVGQQAKKIWTCSMHPQIQLPEAGICPLCPMELIPAAAGANDSGARELVLSDSAVALAEIETVAVERRFVEARVRMFGRVDFDETRTGSVSSRFPGRLERLFVDYTGAPVAMGDKLYEIYSPELLSAQEEFLVAGKSLKKASSSFVRTSARDTLKAARDKLRLWGLSPEQIANLEKSGQASDLLTVYSPMAGIVTRKHLQQGAYVKTGTPVYSLADLSKVWVRLQAFESDLPWLRYGQKVSFSTESNPGKTFNGRLTYIDPILDTRTRTVNLRVVVSNPGTLLKPGMFLRAVVKARVAAAGKVISPEFAGKWISPLHPEIVSDKPGKCTICQVDLVSAESLGYVLADQKPPLVIPSSVPLITGKRAVVYVRLPGKDKPVFEGRDVVLGPRAGDFYLVESGLKVGEQVVLKGAFKIDSAMQLSGKYSMMNPAPVGKPQANCPVMGGKINLKHFTDYQGHRIFFCCPGCDADFNKTPQKYLKKMREAGIVIEKIPAAGGGRQGSSSKSDSHSKGG